MIINQNSNTTLQWALPQDIDTTSSPSFAGVTLSGLTINHGVVLAGAGGLLKTTANSGSNGQILVAGNSVDPAWATIATTTLSITPGSNTLTINTPQPISTTAQVTFGSATLSELCAGASTFYAIGSASQSGGVVTGSGTTFVAGMSGGAIQWASGAYAYILAFVSPGSLVVQPSQTVALGSYTICYNAVQAASQSLSTTSSLYSVGATAVGSTLYATGTASQTTTTVTGSGTTFTSSMVGATIIFSTGQQAFITAFGGTTSLTVSPSQSVTSTSFVIQYSGAIQALGTNVGLMGTIYTSQTASRVLVTSSTGTITTQALTNGQIILGNNGAFAVGTISSTTLSVTGGAGTLTIDAPQPIGTGASPTFVGVTLTGLTTTHAVVLVGAGGQLKSTAASGSNGQILIAGSTVDPAWATIGTSTLTITPGSNTLTIDTPQAIGTGASPTFVGATFTGLSVNHALVITSTGGQLTTTAAAGTNGQVPVGSNGAAPVWATIGSTTLTMTPGAGTLSIDTPQPIGTGASPTFVGTTLTGLTTTHAVVLVGAGGQLKSTAASGTNGQVLIAGSSVDPAWATIGTSTLTITPGLNTLTIDTPQPIGTGASPTFVGATLSGLAANRVVLTAAGGALSVAAGGLTGQILFGVSAAAPAWGSLTSTGGSLTFTTVGANLDVEIAATSTPTFAGITNTGYECTGGTPYVTGSASQSGNTVTGTLGASWGSIGLGSVIHWASGQSGFIVNTVSTTSLTVIPSQTVAAGSYTICNNAVGIAQSDVGIGDSLFLKNALVSGGSLTYATGTASMSTTVVTGVGTTFSSVMVGGLIYWPSLDVWAFITTFNSATSLTTTSVVTVSPAAAYVIYYNGFSAFDGGVGANGFVITGFIAATNNNPAYITSTGTLTSVALGSTPGAFMGIGSGGSLTGLTLTSTGNTMTITPGTSTINLDIATTATPTVTGLTLSNYLCVGSTIYTTGTANQTGNTVLGTGTTWPAAMVGGVIYWANGTAPAYILNQVAANQLTVTPSQTVATGTYTICYNGIQSTGGNIGETDNIWVANAFITGQPLVYATGTASQTGLVITGTGTSFTEGMSGGVIVWPSTGQWAFIIGCPTGTQCSTEQSQSIGAAPFIIWYSGLQSFGGGLGINGPLIVNALAASVGHNDFLYTDINGAFNGIALSNGGFPYQGTDGAMHSGSITSTGNTLTITTGTTTINLDVSSTIAGLTPQNYLTISSAKYTSSPNTASQSGFIVTGSGTAFPGTCAGGVIVWAAGSFAYIVSRDSTTQLTVWPSQTVASGTVTVYYAGSFQAANGWMTIPGNGLQLANGAVLTTGTTIYNTGTLGTGATSTSVVGSGTTWTSAMAGGIILVLQSTQRAFIQSVTSATAATVTPALTWSTGDHYMIIYGGSQNYYSSAGNAGGVSFNNQIYVGTPQAAITNNPATGITIMGSASSNTGLSIADTDQYANFQVATRGHNSIDLLFDANMATGGTYQYSASSNAPVRIRKGASGTLTVDIPTSTGSAGAAATFVTATTFITGGLQLPSTAGGTVTTLGHYTVDSFAVAYTGPCTSALSITVVATRVGRMLFLAFPSANCAVISTNTFNNAAGIPAEYRPAVSQCQPILGLANNVRVQLSINIATNGDTTIYNDGFCNGGGFTTGTSGPFSFTVPLVST